MLIFLGSLVRYKNALFALFWVDIKSSVANTRIGWLWWFLDPLILMLVYYFLVSIVFGRGGENFHLFVLTGIVTWQCFSRSLNSATNSITGKRNILKQTVIPIPLLILVPNLVNLFFAAMGIVVVSVWSYQGLGFATIALLPLLFLLLVVGNTFSIFIAIAQIFFADTAKFIRYITRAGFFLTPVLYPPERISESDKLPEIVKTLFELNPMAWLVTAFRDIILTGKIFDWGAYLIVLTISLLFTQLGLMLLREKHNSIIKSL
jgi:ABC-type polysaccharide/polyol phosphate export permease